MASQQAHKLSSRVPAPVGQPASAGVSCWLECMTSAEGLLRLDEATRRPYDSSAVQCKAIQTVNLMAALQNLTPLCMIIAHPQGSNICYCNRLLFVPSMHRVHS